MFGAEMLAAKIPRRRCFGRKYRTPLQLYLWDTGCVSPHREKEQENSPVPACLLPPAGSVLVLTHLWAPLEAEVSAAGAERHRVLELDSNPGISFSEHFHVLLFTSPLFPSKPSSDLAFSSSCIILCFVLANFILYKCLICHLIRKTLCAGLEAPGILLACFCSSCSSLTLGDLFL